MGGCSRVLGKICRCARELWFCLEGAAACLLRPCRRAVSGDVFSADAVLRAFDRFVPPRHGGRRASVSPWRRELVDGVPALLCAWPPSSLDGAAAVPRHLSGTLGVGFWRPAVLLAVVAGVLLSSSASRGLAASPGRDCQPARRRSHPPGLSYLWTARARVWLRWGVRQLRSGDLRGLRGPGQLGSGRWLKVRDN